MKQRCTIVCLFLLTLTISLILASCGRVRPDQNMNQEKRWEFAKYQFHHENFLNTIDILTSFTLNYSGSTKIDSAQFLLAESHFALGEYIVAESEYNRLLQNTPQSPLAAETQLRIVLCNVYLSPGYGLDQQFTEKALGSAVNYKEDYPQTEVTVRLATRESGWTALGRFFSFGLWKPKRTEVRDASIFNTKVVYPHYVTGFGQWLLKVLTFGLHRTPESALVTPPSESVPGDWVVDRALADSRARLAKKDFKSSQLYFRQKKFPSAMIYSDRVLDLYSDTPWAKPALRVKGDALFKMKRYSEATIVYDKYINLYGDDPVRPVSPHLEQARRSPTPQTPAMPDNSISEPDTSNQPTGP